MRHRHWRGEWSRDEYDATLLVSGFSLGEGIAVLALLGGLIALALNPARTSIDHFAATETLLMSTPHRIDWSEQWAIHGEIPASGSEAITRGNTLRQSNGRSIKDPSDLGRFISRVDQRARRQRHSQPLHFGQPLVPGNLPRQCSGFVAEPWCPVDSCASGQIALRSSTRSCQVHAEALREPRGATQA